MCWATLKSNVFRLGLGPVHNSVGVVGTDLDGTKFRMYAVVSNAYP